jgi:hypothetical protein
MSPAVQAAFTANAQPGTVAAQFDGACDDVIAHPGHAARLF